MRRSALVVATLALVAITTAVHAAPLAPTKASQLADLTVDFQQSCPNSAHAYVVNRIEKSDGTTAPFTIPPKQVFVVTGADIGHQLITSGHRFEASLFREPPSDAGSNLSLVAFADAVSQGAGRIAFDIPNGSVVKNGVLLCAVVLDFAGGGVLSFPNVIVHGFFAKDS